MLYEVITDGLGDIAAQLRDNDALHDLFSPWRLPEGFGVQLVLASAAILCLPRQFHVTVVEFRREDELRLARWVFPAYLMVFAALIVPIALAGLSQFAGYQVNPDSYVLALPIAFDQEALTVLAFLVITSYSIHYTKLYEDDEARQHAGPASTGLLEESDIEPCVVKNPDAALRGFEQGFEPGFQAFASRHLGVRQFVDGCAGSDRAFCIDQQVPARNNFV